MRINLLAKRYAQAVFDLSLELKILDKVQNDMLFIDKVMDENRELRKILANPVLDGWKKIKVFNALFEGKVEPLTIKFLQLITRKGREKYIPFICKSFNEIYREHNNIVGIKLTTASPVDAAIRKDILAKLTKVTNKNVEMAEVVDDDLIGGFIVLYEDFQYDASISKQLKRLNKEFSKNLYIKKY